MTRSLVLAGAVLAVFLPNLHRLSREVVGAAESDALKHVWSQWLVRDQVLSGTLSMQTHLLNFPGGGPFFSLDTVNALLGLPLAVVLGSTLAFNLVLILSLIAAAFAGAALTRQLTDAPWADVLGGLAFALSAWVFAFPLASGVTETIVFWPVPLVLLCAWRTLDQPSLRWPILTGILLTLQGLACWSHGITAGLLLGGMTAAAALHRPDRLRDRALWMRAAVLLGTAVLCSLPLYLAVSGTVSAEDAVKARTLSLFHSAPIGPLAVPEANSMALADFVSPGRWGLRVSQAGTEQLQYAIYPGFVLLILVGLAVRSRQPWTRALLVGVAVMAMLAMGPRIYLDHGRSLGGVPNPVYLLAYWVIPLVNATIHSVDRFAVGLQLCVALLAALGLSQVRVTLRPWVILGVVAELLLLSPGPWPLPMTSGDTHPASAYIAAQPGEGAVVDWPFEADGPQGRWFVGDIFLQQTEHGRPIPFQLEGRGIETASKSMATNPFFHRITMSLLHTHPIPRDCSGADAMGAMGVDFVVWRHSLVEERARQNIGDVLRLCLGDTREFGDRTVFTLRK